MRARAAGDEGLRWLRGLDDRVADLERAWRMRVGAICAGGSEALVAEASLEDGRAAILKIGFPDAADITREAEVLKWAAGRGYADLIAHDGARRAMLLERLGARLSGVVRDVETQIRVICRTLRDAWLPLDASLGLTTGAEKARWLRGFITDRWQRLGRPCDRGTIERAIAFTEEREAAFDAARSVLVHGDAHADNTLLAGDAEDPGSIRCKLIDPDGLLAEKACDLAVPMRDWSAELLAGPTARLAQERCALLARLTDAGERAIWQWGFVERVSTGLTMLEIGLKADGLECLAVADRLQGVRSPGR